MKNKKEDQAMPEEKLLEELDKELDKKIDEKNAKISGKNNAQKGNCYVNPESESVRRIAQFQNISPV